MHCLIDGDVALYRAGFACERTIADELGERQEVDPPEFAIFNIRKLIGSCINKFNAKHTEVFLSGPENFRYKIAKTRPYKGTRDKSAKPVYYTMLREYLITRGAQVSDGIEADDSIGIRAQELRDNRIPFYICSIDKDLLQLPGVHFNWVRDTMTVVSVESALRYYYTQLLTGDVCDNVQGIPRIGPKKAERILNECSCEEEYREKVKEQYLKAYGSEDGEKVFTEHEHLLKILWYKEERPVV